MLTNNIDFNKIPLNESNDRSMGDDYDHYSLSVNEEKIPIGKGMYLTICSNPYTQL